MKFTRRLGLERHLGAYEELLKVNALIHGRGAGIACRSSRRSEAHAVA